MPNMDLLVRVSTLRDLRAVAAVSAGDLRAKKIAYDLDNALLVARVKADAAAVAAEETAIKAVALAYYESLKEKIANFCPGLVVKSFKTLKYKVEDAVAWAKKTGMALNPESLNVEAFEAIASVTTLDFVEKVDVPEVQISKDLDKALSSAEAAADASQVTV